MTEVEKIYKELIEMVKEEYGTDIEYKKPEKGTDNGDIFK